MDKKFYPRYDWPVNGQVEITLSATAAGQLHNIMRLIAHNHDPDYEPDFGWWVEFRIRERYAELFSHPIKFYDPDARTEDS